jgi:Tol biopolymer transport system component
MNSENRFSVTLDSAAGLVTGVLLLAILLTIWFGSQVGIRVTTELSTDNDVGPFERLTLRFSEPVDGSLAIEKVSVQPTVDGSFVWSDPRTLQFVPRAPFQLDTAYTLNLASGSLTQDGNTLKKSKSWEFHARPPRIVYLVVNEGKSRLWTVDVEGGKAVPLTNESFRILAFDASYSGEFVIFSAINDQQGIDLWRVGRDGGEPDLLLPCGPDRCSVPAISFYDRRVAYVREAAGPSPELQFGAPRIWILDLETRENAPLYEDQQIIGYDPVWSPDGTRLSSFDGLADEIRLLDIVTGNQLTIPSQTGDSVTWSADGNTLVFTDIATNELGAYTRVRQAKLITNEIITLVGESDERDYHYKSLAWSPAQDQLVIGLRATENNPSESLWLMELDTLGGPMIADQPDYIYSNPQWDPWGKALVFQQFRLKEDYNPEIALWMPELNEPRVLVEGILPNWLP